MEAIECHCQESALAGKACENRHSGESRNPVLFSGLASLLGIRAAEKRRRKRQIGIGRFSEVGSRYAWIPAFAGMTNRALFLPGSINNF
jgi:hypothetical protein